jgi:hypothetical protein
VVQTPSFTSRQRLQALWTLPRKLAGFGSLRDRFASRCCLRREPFCPLTISHPSSLARPVHCIFFDEFCPNFSHSTCLRPNTQAGTTDIGMSAASGEGIRKSGPTVSWIGLSLGIRVRGSGKQLCTCFRDILVPESMSLFWGHPGSLWAGFRLSVCPCFRDGLSLFWGRVSVFSRSQRSLSGSSNSTPSHRSKSRVGAM